LNLNEIPALLEFFKLLKQRLNMNEIYAKTCPTI